MKIMTIANIPVAVYAVACDYEDIERPANIENCIDAYKLGIQRKGFTQAGLEDALSDYLHLSGAFNEDSGEFAGVSGYRFTTE